MMSSKSIHGGGPCGACKFLRRKCTKGCIFAPYFDPEQGMTHFAAVHKVFGASNVSKLLVNVPPQYRLDAVLTLCYEALARVRDPVYGCVAHIFNLQQQVVDLQAELAYIQARLSILQHLTPTAPALCHFLPSTTPGVSSAVPSKESVSEESGNVFTSHVHSQQEGSDGDLQTLATEFVAKYLPAVKFASPSIL